MQMDNNCNLLSVCTVGGRDIYDSVPILLINFTLSSHRKDKQSERDNSRYRDQRFVVFTPS